MGERGWEGGRSPGRGPWRPSNAAVEAGSKFAGVDVGILCKEVGVKAKVIGFMGFRLTSLVRSSSSSLWSVKPHIGGALNLRCLALGSNLPRSKEPEI